MRQGTLSFFVVPKAEGAKRSGEEIESDAGEEMDLEQCSESDESGESCASGDDDDDDGIDESDKDLASASPSEPESGRSHHFGTWSIPLHLKSRQTGASRYARSAVRGTTTMTSATTAMATSATAKATETSSAPTATRRFSVSPSTTFSTPARHRAAAASAAARSLCPAKVSLPLVFENVASEERERGEAPFPLASASASAAVAAAAGEGGSSSRHQQIRRRRRSDWSVTDLRFDDRTGELLAVALSGPAREGGGGASNGNGGLEGELQLFSDTSVRSSLSLSSPFKSRFPHRGDGDDEDDDDDGFEDQEEEDETREEESEDFDDDDDDDDDDNEGNAHFFAKRHRSSSSSQPAELTALATARFPGGPLLELAWDCRSGSSDVVAALVGASTSSHHFPSGALALFDLDDEEVFSCPDSISAAASRESDRRRRRHATAVIEPISSSSFSSSTSTSSSLAFQPQRRFAAAAAAPPWTSLCASTVRGCFAVGDASGRVHLWDRRASLTRSVGTLSCGRGGGGSGSSGSGGGGGGAGFSFDVAVDAALTGGGSGPFSSSSSSSSSLLPPSVRSLSLLADGQTLVAGCSDGSLRLWDVRSCLGGGSGNGKAATDASSSSFSSSTSTAAGVVSLGGGAVAAFLRNSSSSTPSAAPAALSVGGALPAARGCLRSAVRAVPGVEPLLSGTPENNFADAVALGGVARVEAHPADAARVAFRLDCGWNGAYVFGARGRAAAAPADGGGREAQKMGNDIGDGVGAVTHLHAPPVETTTSATILTSSAHSATSTSRLRLRSAAWGPSSNLVVSGSASCDDSTSSTRLMPTLAVVDCVNAGSAAAVAAASGGERSSVEIGDEKKGQRPFPAAVLDPAPAERVATAVAVHGSSGEVVIGTGDGCLAWFDGGCL